MCCKATNYVQREFTIIDKSLAQVTHWAVYHPAFLNVTEVKLDIRNQHGAMK